MQHQARWQRGDQAREALVVPPHLLEEIGQYYNSASANFWGNSEENIIASPQLLDLDDRASLKFKPTYGPEYSILTQTDGGGPKTAIELQINPQKR